MPGYRNSTTHPARNGVARIQADVIILYEVHNALYESLKALSEPPEATTRPTRCRRPTLGRWLSRHSLLYMKSGVRSSSSPPSLRKRGKKAPGQANAKVAEALNAARWTRAQPHVFVAVAEQPRHPRRDAEVTNISGPARRVKQTRRSTGVELNFAYTTPEVVRRGATSSSTTPSARGRMRRFGDIHPTADFGMRGAEWYAPWDRSTPTTAALTGWGARWQRRFSPPPPSTAARRTPHPVAGNAIRVENEHGGRAERSGKSKKKIESKVALTDAPFHSFSLSVHVNCFALCEE